MVKPIQPVAGGTGQHLFRNLAPGQVVRLQLVEPGINGAIVSLGGRLYRAVGLLPARQGQYFWAWVEKVGSEQITVRHIAPVQPGRDGVSAVDLARVLGLPPGVETEQVLRELLRWGLPVDRETVLRLLAVGRALPQAGCEGFWPALVWLQTRELPSRTGALSKILSYLLGWPEAAPEGQELLNQSGFRLGREQVLTLTLNGGERLQGELYVIIPGGGPEHGVGTRVVLHFRSGVGDDFWVVLGFEADGLTGRVVTDRETRAALFREKVPLLEEGLADLGYRVHPFAVETRRVNSVVDLLSGGEVAAYLPLDVRV